MVLGDPAQISHRHPGPARQTRRVRSQHQLIDAIGHIGSRLELRIRTLVVPELGQTAPADRRSRCRSVVWVHPDRLISPFEIVDQGVRDLLREHLRLTRAQFTGTARPIHSDDPVKDVDGNIIMQVTADIELGSQDLDEH